MAKCGCLSVKSNKQMMIYVLLFLLIFVGTMSLIMNVTVREGLDSPPPPQHAKKQDPECGDKGTMTINPVPYAPGGSSTSVSGLNQNLQTSYAASRCSAKNDAAVQTPKPPPSK
jgi:hypothetical protein